MGCQGAHSHELGLWNVVVEEATGFLLSKYFQGKALAVVEGLLWARHNHKPVTSPM